MVNKGAASKGRLVTSWTNRYNNVKEGFVQERDGTPLYAFLPADSAGFRYLSVIPVLTFDDRDPMELES